MILKIRIRSVEAKEACLLPIIADTPISSYDDESIIIPQPSFLNDTGTLVAYLGVYGTIVVTGTVVTNSIAGPIDVSESGHTFSALSPDTTYAIVLITTNSHGYSVKMIKQATLSEDDVAPVLNNLVISTYTSTSITLALPTYSSAGNPATSALAYLGLSDTISVTDDVVTGYTHGPINVLNAGNNFQGLTAETGYKIIVVASNTNGYSVKTITQSTPAVEGLVQVDDTYKAYDKQINPSIVQNFPSASAIIAAGAIDPPVYGLYSWMGILADQKAAIIGGGSANLRIGGAEWIDRTESWAKPAVDDTFEIFGGTSIDMMYTLMTKARYNFGTNWSSTEEDQDFIDYYVLHLGEFLTEYGPGGTFWTGHSDPDYHVGGSKYKPCTAIEIWNEPDQQYLTGTAYWDALTTSGKADLYSRLLIAAYNYIRAESDWDSVKIVGVSVCGVSHGGPAFVNYVHQKLVTYGGHAQYYDVLSWHPYTHDFPPDTDDIRTGYHYSLVNDQATIRATMDAYGNTDKPIWITEVGWTRPTGTFTSLWFAVSEELQAAYIVRLYMMAIRTGVQKVHVMFSYDADGWNCGFYVHGNWTSKFMQATAAAFMATLMPKPALLEVISETNGYYAYRLKSDADNEASDEIIMIWNITTPTTKVLTCEIGDEYTVYNMLGETNETGTATSTSLSVDIGPYPVYIKGI